jgi:hypothetical protein
MVGACARASEGSVDADDAQAPALDATMTDDAGRDEPEVGAADVGFDAGVPDTGARDVGVPDVGFDTGARDVGVPDTGPRDVGVVDTGPPVECAAGASRFAQGNVHACWLDESARAWCWGGNFYGQTTFTTTSGSPSPVRAPSFDGLALAAGEYFGCVIRSDRTVHCAGLNDAGQIGDGTTMNRLDTVPVLGLTGVTAIAAGYKHACAVVAGGAVRCWGLNDRRQLRGHVRRHGLQRPPAGGGGPHGRHAARARQPAHLRAQHGHHRLVLGVAPRGHAGHRRHHAGPEHDAAAGRVLTEGRGRGQIGRGQRRCASSHAIGSR